MQEAAIKQHDAIEKDRLQLDKADKAAFKVARGDIDNV
jgi:hypothetical protein